VFGVVFPLIVCILVDISKHNEREIMNITTEAITKTQIATAWKNLRTQAIAALGLPADARVRIANNAVTLHANIEGNWVPVMNGSANDMKDWAGIRNYELKLSINI
jgi:hypothetical protein